MDFIFIIINAVFVNNIVLHNFLGLCPVMGTSKNLNHSIAMGYATTFVITISSIISFLIYQYLLLPFELEFMKIIVMIVTIAIVVNSIEIILAKTNPLIFHVFGIYLPLITTNCAVLGVALLVVRKYDTLVETITFSIGSSLGFTLVIIIFASLREKLENKSVPSAFKGIPIALVTLSILSLSFMGFSGI